MSSYRISKVLSELNIGLDTAVDYLKSKGHEVEKNRNAKIDQAQYDLLLESFASDKTSKDKAETLIQQKREEKEAIQAERIEAEKAKPEVIPGVVACPLNPQVRERARVLLPGDVLIGDRETTTSIFDRDPAGGPRLRIHVAL